MEIEITVRMVKGSDGTIVARAVGYPGVMTFGRTEEEVVSEIGIIWQRMAQINAIKTVGNKQRPIYKGTATETNVRLQVA